MAFANLTSAMLHRTHFRADCVRRLRVRSWTYLPGRRGEALRFCRQIEKSCEKNAFRTHPERI